MFSSLQLEENSMSASNRLYLKGGLQKAFGQKILCVCVSADTLEKLHHIFFSFLFLMIYKWEWFVLHITSYIGGLDLVSSPWKKKKSKVKMNEKRWRDRVCFVGLPTSAATECISAPLNAGGQRPVCPPRCAGRSEFEETQVQALVSEWGALAWIESVEEEEWMKGMRWRERVRDSERNVGKGRKPWWKDLL